jgi:hypothetical protein
MITSPQECLNEIRIAEQKVNNYETNWKIWDTKYKTLLNEWELKNNKVIEEDLKLYNWLLTEINSNPQEIKIYTLEDQYSESCNNEGRCRTSCQGQKNNYITPLGKILGINISSRATCNRPCCKDCFCKILTSNSINYFNNEKNRINNIIKERNVKLDELNKLNGDMPQPEGFEIRCCLSNIDCKKGKCIGSIQICRLENTNKLGTNQTEVEKNNKDNVENIKKDIDNILIRIINLSDIIYENTNKLYEIIKQDDKKNIITELGNLDSNLNNSIKTINDIIKDVDNKKKDADTLNNLTNSNSIYKMNIKDNLDLINTYITSINNYVLLINNNYSNFKNFFDNYIKEDNNLNLLNVNKKENEIIINNLNKYISEFNNNIEEANKLNSISNNNLDKLLNLYKSCVYLKQNIDDEKIILDRNNKSLADLFKNFNERDSLNYSYAYSIYMEITKNILDINRKINGTNISDKINNLNSKYLSQKKEYNDILIKQENEEKQKKINEDILLLKIIEQNNVINKSMEISDKLINNNYQENKQTESSNYVIYIIIGIILLGFFIIKK